MPQLKFRPTKDKLLIEPLSPLGANLGSIAIPEAFRDDKPTEGIVLAIGPQVTEPKLGDRVLFNRFEGTDIKIDSKSFKLFQAKEILAVIE